MSTIDTAGAWRGMNSHGLVPSAKGQQPVPEPLSDSTDALNPAGQNASQQPGKDTASASSPRDDMQSRITGIAKQFGYNDTLTWSQEGNSISILDGPPEGLKQIIEAAVNKDGTLKTILADQKTEEGGYYASNGRDSAQFSAEAMQKRKETEQETPNSPLDEAFTSLPPTEE